MHWSIDKIRYAKLSIPKGIPKRHSDSTAFLKTDWKWIPSGILNFAYVISSTDLPFATWGQTEAPPSLQTDYKWIPLGILIFADLISSIESRQTDLPTKPLVYLLSPWFSYKAPGLLRKPLVCLQSPWFTYEAPGLLTKPLVYLRSP